MAKKEEEYIIPDKLTERLFNIMTSIYDENIKLNKMETNNLNYKFIAESVVTTRISDEFIKNRIMIIPLEVKESKQNFQDWVSPETDRFSKPIVTTRLTSSVTMRYKIVNVDNEEDHLIVEAIGDGSDNMDKATSKAMTAVLKQLWRHLFLIPAPQSDDPDTTPSVSIGTPSVKGSNKTSNGVGDFLVTFGNKHNGKTLDEIYKDDPGYIDWLKSKTKDDNVRQVVTEFLNSRG